MPILRLGRIHVERWRKDSTQASSIAVLVRMDAGAARVVAALQGSRQQRCAMCKSAKTCLMPACWLACILGLPSAPSRHNPQLHSRQHIHCHVVSLNLHRRHFICRFGISSSGSPSGDNLGGSASNAARVVQEVTAKYTVGDQLVLPPTLYFNLLVQEFGEFAVRVRASARSILRVRLCVVSCGWWLLCMGMRGCARAHPRTQ